MLILTFYRPNDLASSLNINCKFYNMTKSMDDKVIFYNGTDFDMSLGWVHLSLLPVPYPCFEIGKNTNPVKVGKTRQIGVGSDG